MKTSVPQPIKIFSVHQVTAYVLPTGTKYQAQARSVLLILTLGATLLAMSIHARAAEPGSAKPAQPALQFGAAPDRATTAVARTAPKYAAQDIERAFGFLDSNHDGKISRGEAAGFKNVAKYFDAADSDKDGTLSREEFDNALNGAKPQ